MRRRGNTERERERALAKFIFSLPLLQHFHSGHRGGLGAPNDKSMQHMAMLRQPLSHAL